MRAKLSKVMMLSVALLATLFFICLGYAYFVEPTKLVVNSQELRIVGLDRAFDGLKIVTIGDVHGGSNDVTPAKLRQIVELTNIQEPDLVVLLGDYVSERAGRGRLLRMPIEQIADGLAGIRSKYGVFVVLGNHDGFYGDEKVAAEFTRVGYRVLQHEVAPLEINGKRLRILGLKDHLHMQDAWTKTSRQLRAILAGSGEGQIIVLEHSPDVAPMITGDLSISPDLKLILAAHTHGGQVWLPLLGTPIVPSSYGQRYAYGHVRENGVDMFVDSGIGTSILPIRFMMPPQIGFLTLRSE